MKQWYWKLLSKIGFHKGQEWEEVQLVLSVNIESHDVERVPYFQFKTELASITYSVV